MPAKKFNPHKLAIIPRSNICTKANRTSCFLMRYFFPRHKGGSLQRTGLYSSGVWQFFLVSTRCFSLPGIRKSAAIFAFLFNCTPAGRTSDCLRVDAWCNVCGQAHWDVTVRFLLLRYSVVCTVESLSFILSPIYILICMY